MKASPPSQLFPSVEAASKVGTGTGQPWASSYFFQEQAWPQPPTSESPAWKLAPPQACRTVPEEQGGVCVVMRAAGDSGSLRFAKHWIKGAGILERRFSAHN